MVMDLDLLKLLLTGKLTIDAKFLWCNVKKMCPQPSAGGIWTVAGFKRSRQLES